MRNTTFDNPLLENCIAELSKLPGIGEKTALRLALHILRGSEADAQALGNSIIRMREEITYCKKCHNLSTTEICPICADSHREQHAVCVVENVKDVIAIEATAEFHGLYHVLGGLISPLEGIGPQEIELDSLVERVKQEDIKEVLLALSPTMEGDTTNFYIFRRLQDLPVEVTTLARGISIGNELEFTDELTLGRSIQNRVPYSSTFNH